MSVPVHARGLILAVSCLSLAPVETRAQTLPKHFLGVWIVDAGDDRACKSAEWKNARQDYHINITPKGIDFWETRCQFNSVRATEKSGNDPATLTMSCRGEGSTWKESNIWQLHKSRGQLLLIRVNTTRTYVSVYRQCS